jgi:putative CocE/NonD family hydrolase
MSISRCFPALLALSLRSIPILAQTVSGNAPDTSLAIPMRDTVLLIADVLLPQGEGPHPVLLYRTPYDKRRAREEYPLFHKAVDRGYAVVLQDVRGRYASSGEFTPFRNEGADGYDTIEWIANQPWSTGDIGTIGHGYAGTAQWLAAMESPPHLRAMVPAMSFATPRSTFYSGGVWNLSWIDWIWLHIAPDTRVRNGIAGARTEGAAAEQWPRVRDQMRGYLPLRGLPALRQVAPWYYEWLNHPAADTWWAWADLTGKYRRTQAAVLNLTGWHDQGSGLSGAIQNFRGLIATRPARSARSRLVIGPWSADVSSIARTTVGERQLGDQASMDYDELVLRWMDRHLRGVDNGVDQEAPVQAFVMGENRWVEGTRWPLTGNRVRRFYLAGPDTSARFGRLMTTVNTEPEEFSVFESDPAQPVIDPHGGSPGAHDYRSLAGREDVLTFETAPLEQELRVVGGISAEIYLAVEGQDTDLWVRVQDVAPDGTAYNLMHPGLDVLRASYRNQSRLPQLLTPDRVYRLTLNNLLTGNLFRQGHRLRIQISTTFYPWFSRNLHTGDSEIFSDNMQPARITVYHDRRRPSRLTLSVME